MTELKECPICFGNHFDPFINCEDFTVSHKKFNIVSCTKCNFKFTNPRPPQSEIGDYYRSEDYISHSNTNKGIISKIYKAVRNYTLSKKVKLIESYNKPGNLLDYGAGTGMFLQKAKSSTWNVYGIEPDEGARKVCRDINGIELYEDISSAKAFIENIDFDVITLWHVLEHVLDINDTIEWFSSKLRHNGTLIIAVPNYCSYDAEHYKEFWAAYDVPRHLYHFSPNTIKDLFSRHGFRLVNQMPMKFDSYYVSLLSEKYRSGTSSLINAFYNGFKSNLKAKRSGNYSSLIYIFKKA